MSDHRMGVLVDVCERCGATAMELRDAGGLGCDAAAVAEWRREVLPVQRREAALRVREQWLDLREQRLAALARRALERLEAPDGLAPGEERRR